MTDKDRDDIKQIIREAMRDTAGGCSLGLKPETAHELISLADTWKTCRRGAWLSLIGLAAGAVATAVYQGVKTLLTK